MMWRRPKRRKFFVVYTFQPGNPGQTHTRSAELVFDRQPVTNELICEWRDQLAEMEDVTNKQLVITFFAELET
jgi:hypothetical protein